MNISKRMLVVTLSLVGVILLGASSCDTNGGTSFTGGGGFKDLKGIAPQDPDKTWLINNVDGFPNIVMLCANGVMFATTSREAAGAILRVPEADGRCSS